MKSSIFSNTFLYPSFLWSHIAENLLIFTSEFSSRPDLRFYMGDYRNLQKYARETQLKKMDRLIAHRPKHMDEKYMNTKMVDDYIESMAINRPDDPEVSDRLLRWKKMKEDKTLSNKSVKTEKELKTRELDLKEKEIVLKYQNAGQNPLGDDV